MGRLVFGDPDYKGLRCPQCGNEKEFVEFAYVEVKQPLRIAEDGPDFEAYEGLDSSHYPNEIVCGKCYYEKDELIPVWQPEKEGD